MDFLFTVEIIVYIQGLLLGMLILFNRPAHVKAYGFLGTYLILQSLSNVTSVLEDQGLTETIPWLALLPVNFYFVFPVFLLLYAQEIAGIREGKTLSKRFIPGIIEIILLIILMMGLLVDFWELESAGIELIRFIYVLIAVIFMVRHLVKIIRLINKVKGDAENCYSSLNWKTLDWLRIGCYLILISFLINVIIAFVPASFELGLFWTDTLLQTTVTFWLAIHGFKQTAIIGALESSVKPTELSQGGENEKVPKVIPLEEDKKRYEELVVMVAEKGLYKNQELTLADLAEEAGIHQKQLSFLINQFSGKNFFNFVNEHRVKEAQRLLIDKQYEHLSFLGIAFEAGFNSKATFNASFKKVTGQTPRQYKASLQSA